MDDWSAARYRLDTRFVHLTLLRDHGAEAVGERFQPTSESFRDLHEVLERLPDDPAVVLLGAPGAGKSTLLRHYELETAQDSLAVAGDLSQQPLTFYVPLNAYKPSTDGAVPPVPGAWLAARWARQCPGLPSLDTLLQAGRLTLLLDALNEMPRTLVPRWSDWLQALVLAAPRTRVVFSCRSLDYSALLADAPLHVPQVRLQALSDTQVEVFLRSYCAPAVAESLWTRLRQPQEKPLLDVLRSPYYLQMLVQWHPTGALPRGRAALFTGFVWQALRREVQRRTPAFQLETGLLTAHEHERLRDPSAEVPPSTLPSDGLLVPGLRQLAWHMQQQRGTGAESAQMRLDYKTALALLGGSPVAETILQAGVALGLLEQDRVQDTVLFVHHLMQEYCAACLLAQTPQPALAQQPWRARPVGRGQRWLDALLPVPGRRSRQVETVPEALPTTLAGLHDSEPLPQLESTGWEEATVLAAAIAPQADAFVADLMAVNLPLAGRCAAQPDVQVSDALKDQIRWALVQRTQDRHADLRARIAAGLALGPLGDPRFERRRGPYGAYLLPPLTTIPGGTYRIGSDEGLYADEAPVHAVVLASFALGQFPVTNAEWALFMQAGGYEEERWWETEEAQQWRRGEGTNEGSKQELRETRAYWQQHPEELRQLPQQGRATSQYVESWEALGALSDETFEAQLVRVYPSGRQTEPAFWHDDAFNNMAQPVVGICWYEARAYCAWLSAQTGTIVRLPTEVEWEAAARGASGRRYAYGNTLNAAYGNTFETHIRRTTPIGVFPGSTTPEGLVDMTGNTWDWTSSQYKDYKYNAADGREDLYTNLARRVVRGGSWYDGLHRARASSRSHDAPVNRVSDVGLRVVRVVP